MCELKLGNHPTVKLIDNQIDPEWIKETKELRNYLKEIRNASMSARGT